MTIRAVLFDADGVIILPNHFADYLDQELKITRAMTQEFFTGPFLDCLIGKADLKRSIEPYLPQWGWKGSVEEFLHKWFDVEKAVDARLINTVAHLRQRGIICGIATNQELYRLAYMKTEMGFVETFDTIFCSAELGAMKHEIVYYEQVTKRLALENHEILFWDDTYQNINVAQNYGWQAEHYINFELFHQALQSYIK